MVKKATLTSAAVSPGAEFSSIAATFAEVADRARLCATASHIASRDLERVLTAAIKLYAAKAESEVLPSPPLSADKITPTEVVVVVSEMMRAVDLNLFDLSMWYRRAR
jgi:hypothetical protein